MFPWRLNLNERKQEFISQNMNDNWSLSNFDSNTEEPQTDSLGRQLQSIINRDEHFQHAISQAPPRLREEQLDWEKRFPKLIVYGKTIEIKQPMETQKNEIKMALVQKLVNDNLWPQVRIFMLLHIQNLNLDSNDARD